MRLSVPDSPLPIPCCISSQGSLINGLTAIKTAVSRHPRPGVTFDPRASCHVAQQLLEAEQTRARSLPVCPRAQTPNPKPQTPNPSLQFLNLSKNKRHSKPKHNTLNLKLQTLNPCLRSFWKLSRHTATSAPSLSEKPTGAPRPAVTYHQYLPPPVCPTYSRHLSPICPTYRRSCMSLVYASVRVRPHVFLCAIDQKSLRPSSLGCALREGSVLSRDIVLIVAL